MAKYIQINRDGTRTEVRYNHCHDGPVSERIHLVKRLNFLRSKLKSFPADKKLRHQLHCAHHALNALDKRFPVNRYPGKSVSRQPKHAGISATPETRGKQPDSRNIAGVPIRLHNGPGNRQGTAQREENATVPITHGGLREQPRDSGVAAASVQHSNADADVPSSASPMSKQLTRLGSSVGL
jgi:hypothetical protein